MRLHKQLELSFVAKLVEDTKRLIKGPKSAGDKIAALQGRAQHFARRTQALREMKLRAGGSPERRARLRTLIALREKGLGYLKSTASYIVNRENHPYTLRQKPRMFATPLWDQHVAIPEPVDRDREVV